MCEVNTRVTKSYQINQWAILVKGGGAVIRGVGFILPPSRTCPIFPVEIVRTRPWARVQSDNGDGCDTRQTFPGSEVDLEKGN